MLRRFATGFTVAAGIASVARRARALSPDGAAAATLVGGAVFAGTGFRGGAALTAFFVSSSLLSRLPASAAATLQRRGNERDAVQVLANGGIPAALALLAAYAPLPARRGLLAGAVGAVAAATADTWATEIGARFGRQARSIATLQPVPPGTSGGITGAGLLASAAGSALIAAVTRFPGSDTSGAELPPAWPIVAGGIAGSVTDSLLGATIQGVRFCDVCGQESEALTHACGTPTHHLRGIARCDNDLVNLLAISVGAAVTTIASGPADHARHGRSIRM